MFKLPPGCTDISIYNIKSPTQSKRIQDTLFRAGYFWEGLSPVYERTAYKSLHPCNGGSICYGDFTSKRKNYDLPAEAFLAKYGQTKPTRRRKQCLK